MAGRSVPADAPVAGSFECSPSLGQCCFIFVQSSMSAGRTKRSGTGCASTNSAARVFPGETGGGPLCDTDVRPCGPGWAQRSSAPSTRSPQSPGGPLRRSLSMPRRHRSCAAGRGRLGSLRQFTFVHGFRRSVVRIAKCLPNRPPVLEVRAQMPRAEEYQSRLVSVACSSSRLLRAQIQKYARTEATARRV